MLENDTLILRAPEPEDIEFLYRLENDQRLWHVSQTRRPFSRFELEQYILMADKDPFEAKQVRFIIRLHTGDTAGTIDLFDIDPYNRRAGVGITIIDNYRNQGLATSALALLTDYAFHHLDLHQLYCNVESDNKASLQLFKKAGFLVAGLKKDWNKHGKRWKDEYFLQLINK